MIAETTEPTGFLGLSHLGLTYGCAWASLRQPVIATDPCTQTVAAANQGELFGHEPGLGELLERHRPWITFTADLRQLAHCPLVLVTQDVPTDDADVSDPGTIERLIETALPYLRPRVVLVVLSQVPPGFTRKLADRLRDARPDLACQLYYWVETLVLGDAVRRALEPERLIIGSAVPSTPLPPILQRALQRFGCPILPMSYESAELTKAAINLYLAGSVTYANTLADLCEAAGADWAEMTPALRLDHRIGSAAYLQPSLGVAGGNLERDLTHLRQLARCHHVQAPYLDTLAESNGGRLDWLRRRLDEHVFARQASPTIGVWGLTYKKHTRSTKNAPAARVLAELRGRAHARAWDPAVAAAAGSGVESAATRDDVLPGADCLLILADWDDFATADLAAIRHAMRYPLVIDCTGVLQPRRHEMAGIAYVSMGRAA